MNMTTEQKLHALARVLDMVFEKAKIFLSANEQAEIRRTLDQIKASNVSGGNKK